MSVHWGGKGPNHTSRWSPLILGVPTLDLNFAATPILDNRISFARSSTATVIDSSGAMQSVAVNAPRFDYDPVTRQSRGLLIEEARSNVLLNSLLSGVSLLTQSVTVSAVAYTLSFYGTGTITLTGAHSATVVGTGAFPSRRTLTFTPGIGALLLTVTGTVQFAQLEVGAFATSFIPTAGILASRSADVATMTGSNFSSWYNQGEGTFVYEASALSGIYGYRALAIARASGGITDCLDMSIGSGAGGATGVFRDIVVVGGVTQADIGDFAAFSGNTAYKGALGYKLNDFAAATSGGNLTTDNSGSVPTVSLLEIGNRNSANFLNGHVRSIRYFNRRLSNNQLQTLTST